MTLSSMALRTYQRVHTWAGLTAGMALFVAFYAGSLTLFHEELRQWADPGLRAVGGQSLDDAQVLLERAIAQHPDAADYSYLILQGPYSAETWLNWPHRTAGGETVYLSLSSRRADAYDRETDGGGSVADLIDHLHFTLGLPESVGEYLMGVVCLLYALALVSGLIIHLPQLLKDLFALRVGANLKRLWQDAHNVIGVLSLPFHLMYAFTGALLTLSLVFFMALNVLALDQRLTHAFQRLTAFSVTRPAAGAAAPMLPLRQLVERAQAALPGLQPGMLFVAHYGDRNAVVTVRGPVSKRLLQDSFVSLDAVSGEVLGRQSSAGRSPYGTAATAIAALHYASYGGLVLRLLYCGLGLAGAFLFFSGNLLWLERRRKRRQTLQPRHHRLLAGLTVGVCLGAVFGIACALLAARLLPESLIERAQWEWRVYYAAFAFSLGWAALRSPGRAAVELLSLCAVTTAAAPLLNWITTGDDPLHAAVSGRWAVLGVDTGLLALAAAWAWIARTAWLRIHSAPADSVWS